MMVMVVMKIIMLVVIVMVIPCPGKARSRDLTSWGFVAGRGSASTRLASALH